MDIAEIYTFTHIDAYLYFLFSDTRGIFYVGISNDVNDRLSRHNSGQSLSTKSGITWELMHTLEWENKSVAMILETKIKKRGIGRYLSDNNIFIGL